MSITVTSSTSGTPAVQSPAGAAGTLTFTNLNGGTSFAAGSTVVVWAFGKNEGNVTAVTGPAIGGNAMTSISLQGNGDSTGCLLYVDLASSATDTFTTTNTGGSWTTLFVIAWQLVGAATGGPASNVFLAYANPSSNPQTFPSITGLTGGAIIAGGGTDITGGQTPVWTNCTAGAGDMTTSNTTVSQSMGAHSTNVGATVITNSTTGIGFGFGGALGAWAVAAAAPSGLPGILGLASSEW